MIPRRRFPYADPIINVNDPPHDFAERVMRRAGERRAEPVAMPFRARLMTPDITPDNSPPGSPREGWPQAVPFWDIIGGLQWRSRSDGLMNREAIRMYFANVDMEFFLPQYYEKCRELDAILQQAEFYDHHGYLTRDAQMACVSHAVALGREQYATLCTELTVMDYLAECEEFQSLDDMLPR